MRLGWGRALWGLVAAVLVTVGCSDRGKATRSEGRPSMEPQLVDFGRLPVHDVVEQEVVLRNFGRAPLKVHEAWVQGPEGTFRADFVEEGPHEVHPGGECRLKVRFSPRAAGAGEGELVVRTDSTTNTLARMALKGVGVDTAATVQPGLLDFGRIEAQASKALPLTLENPTELATEVRLKVVGADAAEFQLLPAVPLAPGEKRELTVEWRPMQPGRKQVALAVSRCRGCTDSLVRMTAEALDKAVVAEPPEVNFGQTPVDRELTRTVVLRNVSTEPQVVKGMGLPAGTDASFRVEGPAFPLTLPPGGTTEVTVFYSPGHMGAARGTLEFSLESVRNPVLPVGLEGYGGAPELCVSPVTVDFGEQPVGSKTVVTVSVRNCGAQNANPLTVERMELVGGAPFGVMAETLPRTLAAGEEMTVRVFYEPTVEASSAGELVLHTSGGQQTSQPIALSGVSRMHAPCEVQVTPGAVDFGTVLPGWGAVLAVKVHNPGTDVCAVKNIHLSRDAGGAFSMPGGRLEGIIVYPGDAFAFQVAFVAPAGGGGFMGMVRLEQANPARPVLEVPLVANSQDSCVVASPNFLDFGLGRPDCPPRPLTVSFSNGCSTPVTVGNARVGPGTTDGQFALLDTLVGPRELQPGESVSLEVEYLAQVPGMNASPLFLDVAGLDAPLLVPLHGESSTRMEQTDRFVQTDGSKVDVLFVVDNTASMVEEQPRLVAGLPSFVDAATSRGVDLHVAVTTTGIEAVAGGSCPGGARGGEAGRLFPVDGSNPRLLTSGMPDLAALLQQNAQVGQCAVVEKGLEAVRRALTPPLSNGADDPRTSQPNDGNGGFLRSEAALVVVFVGDEDDHSPDSVESYVQAYRAVKGASQPHRVSIYAIAPTQSGCATAGGAGTRYQEAAQLTGGDVLSVCASDYAPLLRQVAQQVFSPEDRFPLTSTPDPGSLEVRVDGVAVGGWRYDAGGNAIVFTSQPAPGARIEVQYRRTCP